MCLIHYVTFDLIQFSGKTKYGRLTMSSEWSTLADSGFFKNFLYEGGVKSTVSLVFEDLKFKISEGYNQNWCFPDPAHLAVSV